MRHFAALSVRLNGLPVACACAAFHPGELAMRDWVDGSATSSNIPVSRAVLIACRKSFSVMSIDALYQEPP